MGKNQIVRNIHAVISAEAVAINSLVVSCGFEFSLVQELITANTTKGINRIDSPSLISLVTDLSQAKDFEIW